MTLTKEPFNDLSNKNRKHTGRTSLRATNSQPGQEGLGGHVWRGLRGPGWRRGCGGCLWRTPGVSENTPRAHSRLQHPESPPGPPHCPGLTSYSRSTAHSWPPTWRPRSLCLGCLRARWPSPGLCLCIHSVHPLSPDPSPGVARLWPPP